MNAKTSVTSAQAAALSALSAYLQHRSEAEGVPFALPLEHLASSYNAGIRRFFGVTLKDHPDGTCSLEADDQEPRPGFLAAWIRNAPEIIVTLRSGEQLDVFGMPFSDEMN